MGEGNTVGIEIKANAGQAVAEFQKAGQAGQEMSQSLVTGNLAGADAMEKQSGSLRDVALGLKSGKMLAGSMAAAMQGDFSSAMRVATLGVKGLNTVLKASPIGAVVAALAIGVTVFTSFSHAQKDAAAEAKDAGGAIKGVGKSAGEAAPEVEKVATAADHVKAGMDGAKTQADGIANSFKTAAEEAAHLRKKLDELEDAQLQVDLADIEGDRLSGKISGPEADKRKAGARNTAAKGKLDREAAENARQIEAKQREQEQLGYGAKDAEGAREKARADAIAAEKVIEEEEEAQRARTAEMAERELSGASIEGSPMSAEMAEANAKSKALIEQKTKEAQEAWGKATEKEAQRAKLAADQAARGGEIDDLKGTGKIIGLKQKAQDRTGKNEVAEAEQKAVEEQKRDEEKAKRDAAKAAAEAKKRAAEQRTAAVKAAKEKALAATNELEEFDNSIKGAKDRVRNSKKTQSKRAELEKRVIDAKAEVTAAEQDGELTPEQKRKAALDKAGLGGKGKKDRRIDGTAKPSLYDEQEAARRKTADAGEDGGMGPAAAGLASAGQGVGAAAQAINGLMDELRPFGGLVASLAQEQANLRAQVGLIQSYISGAA